MNLFDLAERQIADTSLEAYQRILPTLSKREIAVFLALCDLSIRYGDATGGEIAEDMGTLVTSVRPRLTGLEAKGWVQKTPARQSRAKYEGRCHGYRHVVPKEAVERMKEQHS